jgi:hypothetical protein
MNEPILFRRHGQTGSCSVPQVRFEEIVNRLLESRFWITSEEPTMLRGTPGACHR